MEFHRLKSYLPLLIIVALALAMSLVVRDKFYISVFMSSAMGFFLCMLSMFKLFDINGFVDGFQIYDIIAKRYRFYGYAYPFMELGLGLSLLANTAPLITNLLMSFIMIMSAISVIKSV